MATFREIMDAAHRADQAGNSADAHRLLQIATGMQGSAQSGSRVGAQSVQEGAPGFSGVSVPTINDGTETSRIDNFGDTIRDATAAPAAATAQSFNSMMDPNRTTLQRVGDAGMTALNAAGTTYAFGAGLVGETLGGSPTMEKKLARDLMMAGEVAVPELGGGINAATRAANKSVSAAKALEVPPSAKQAQARAADELGVTPSLGAGGKARGMTAATLEKVPGSGGVIARDAERFVGEVEDVFRKASADVGTARGAAEAGEALQSGLRRFVLEFKAKSKTLFDAVGKEIPEGTAVPLSNTTAVIGDVKAAFSDLPEMARKLGLNEWDTVLAEANEKGLNWQAARQFRTQIGQALGDSKGALGDESRSRLKSLYGALTEDMEAAANAAGPKAKKAWSRANTYYRRGAQRIEKDLDKSVSADSPERAFEAFAAMAQGDKARSNSTRLYKIKSSMNAEDWKTVSASVIDRLGKVSAGRQGAAGDTFSPAAFLTEWNKLSREAKSILLPPEPRKQMEQLARVSEGVKDANAERNFSNTGSVVTGATAGAGLASVPATTVAVLLTANVSSRAMTSQRFLRAMNRAARGDQKQIKIIANGNSPFAEDARTILRITAAEAAQGSAPANTDQSPFQAVGQ